MFWNHFEIFVILWHDLYFPELYILVGVDLQEPLWSYLNFLKLFSLCKIYYSYLMLAGKSIPLLKIWTANLKNIVRMIFNIFISKLLISKTFQKYSGNDLLTIFFSNFLMWTCGVTASISCRPSTFFKASIWHVIWWPKILVRCCIAHSSLGLELSNASIDFIFLHGIGMASFELLVICSLSRKPPLYPLG